MSSNTSNSGKNGKNLITPSSSARKTPKISKEMLDRCIKTSSTFFPINISSTLQSTVTDASTNGDNAEETTNKHAPREIFTTPIKSKQQDDGKEDEIDQLLYKTTQLSISKKKPTVTSPIIPTTTTKPTTINQVPKPLQHQQPVKVDQKKEAEQVKSNQSDEEDEEEILIPQSHKKIARKQVIILDSDEEEDEPIKIINNNSKQSLLNTFKQMEDNVKQKSKQIIKEEEEEEEEEEEQKLITFKPKTKRISLEDNNELDDVKGSKSYIDDDDPFGDEQQKDSNTQSKTSRLRKFTDPREEEKEEFDEDDEDEGEDLEEESDEEDDDDEDEEEEEEEEEEEIVEKVKDRKQKKQKDIQKQDQKKEKEEIILEDQHNGFLKNGDIYQNSTLYNDRKFILSEKVYNGLFWYQREGVDWLWRLYCKQAGGILGDDMGLGKTIQIITFLQVMHKSQFITHSLVVMPVSLIEHWVKEFAKNETGIKIRVYHGSNVRERDQSLEYIKKHGGVLITTYGMIVSNVSPLKEYKRKTFTWDYIILDEGHKIKETKTKISKTMRELYARHKIIMTGTAIQNNLKELWALFDWVCDGTLLGSVRSFNKHFQQPIIKSHISDSSLNDKKKGLAIAESLRSIIAPHFLRREKKDVFPTTNAQQQDKENMENYNQSNQNNSKLSISSTSSSSTSTSTTSSLGKKRMSVRGIKTRKNDFVCWIKMAQPQVDLYSTFLESEEVKDALNKTSSPLAALTVLKKICDHPLLLHEEMKMCNSNNTMMDLIKKVGDSNVNIKSMVRNSGKMQFLYYLLPNLKDNGNRILIFSQSVKMLNNIQQLLDYLKLSHTRIDGSITSTKERQKRIDEYNSDRSIFCFLLTIQVGALGLNLTSADRVLIFDPSWTTVDNQAVDRVYRIGQQKDVVVYRLITCGTIEEKIYRKQVFKGSLMKTMMDNSQQEKGQHRYFSHDELKKVFIMDDPNESTTQQYLQDLHSKNRKSSPELDNHLAFLKKIKILYGVSDHDLLFSEELKRDCDEEEMQSLINENNNNMRNVITPSKQPSKKKITYITRDTPNKTKQQQQKFIYIDNDYYKDEEDEMFVEKLSSHQPPPLIIPTSKRYSSSTSTSTTTHQIKSESELSSSQSQYIDLSSGKPKEVIVLDDDSDVDNDVNQEEEQYEIYYDGQYDEHIEEQEAEEEVEEEVEEEEEEEEYYSDQDESNQILQSKFNEMIDLAIEKESNPIQSTNILLDIHKSYLSMDLEKLELRIKQNYNQIVKHRLSMPK